MDLRHRIAIRVKEIRKARGLTQEAVADLIGRSVDAVSLLERGKIVPSLDTLQALSTALDISIHDLLDFGDKPAKDKEVIALQSAAVEIIRRLNKSVLAVAVRQLEALAELKVR